MEFKEQSSKQVITRNFEADNNGYRYEIKVSGTYVEMKIYINKKAKLNEDSVSEGKSSYPIGIISSQDGVRKILIEGDINEHVDVFNKFMETR